MVNTLTNLNSGELASHSRMTLKPFNFSHWHDPMICTLKAVSTIAASQMLNPTQIYVHLQRFAGGL